MWCSRFLDFTTRLFQQVASGVYRRKKEEIDGVKETATEELKSYSCTSALAPRIIVSAVKTVGVEDGRNRNLLVFGNEGF